AQSARVPSTLPDDPYVVVRQEHLVYTDTESEPFKDLRETKIPQQLLVVPSPIASPDYLHLIVGHAHTPATIDTESGPEGDPSKKEDFLPLVSTRLTDKEFKDRTYGRAYPAYLVTRPSLIPSPTLPIRKRYQGTSELILDTKTEDDESKAKGAGSGSKESEDEVPDLEGEEAAPEGQQQSVPDQHVADKTPTPKIPVRTTRIDHEDGTVYLDIENDPRSCAPVQTPASPEWSFGSLLVSPASLTVPSPIASPVTAPAATIAVDEDEFLEVRAQLELYRSILHDHTQRLDALPPALFKGYDRDLKELYTRSRAVQG
nr:hypothetical protein [Tanacetum cinerariifolium]